eukprot:CAMPEP_0114507372 /NCGR_PEP_ID=MMETSP0109-20121206/11975_1 /TAXON_ID=29199 /ORGANISM="Chlorarachnion reptans, Strain CCCM449" /LENGTH=854 /DNA_ID=CAMNT_0001686121 /DNA_START=234 /DNA_END=2798 /DNA_ORIENTATION=-
MTNRFYEKIELYDMQWDGLDLSKCHVAVAPFGGLIAIAPDGSEMGANKVRIFTSAGRFLSEFRWPHKGLVGMGWTDSEHLVVVIAEGENNVFVYSIHGECLNSFLIPQCKVIAECSIWGSGLVCRAAGTHCDFYAVQNFHRPRVTKLRSPSIPFKPSAMVPIPANQNPHRKLEVLLASPHGSIHIISNSEPVEVKATQDERRFNEPFLKIALSPSGRYLAAVNKTGTLTVMESDFSATISEFITKHSRPPLDVAWCGEDSVLLYWEQILIMVGPFGAYVAFKYPQAKKNTLRLQTQEDGCIVLTSSQCELLRKVPEPVVTIFKSKSKEPASQVFAASRAFERSNIAADLCIRQLKNSGKEDHLRDAVLTCLEAALHCFHIEAQAALLKAASYGKLFCEDRDGYLRDTFVERCKYVRVLHNVRQKNVGIPLTYSQFKALGIEVLIERLVHRHEHLLALRICELMKLSTMKQKTLEHWACAKIRSSGTEDYKKLGREIIEKLKICPGISFGKIAETAFNEGLKELATSLLEHEPKSKDQVNLLLNMDQEERALRKAVESRDSDLIMSVLLYLLKRLPGGSVAEGPVDPELDPDGAELQSQFFRILNQHSQVLLHLIAYYEGHSMDPITVSGRRTVEALKRLFYELKLEAEAARTKVIESYFKHEWKQRIRMMEIAQDLFKANPFAVAATKAQTRLLQVQRKCQIDFKKPFIDLSVNQTLAKLIRLGHTDRASRIRKEFAVPEKRYWHIQVQTLAKEKDFNGLNQLAQSRRTPPIGFEPFIEACVENEAYTEAVKYISKLSVANEKMEWFCSIHCYGEAAEVAHGERNVEALRYISSRAKAKPMVKARVDEMIKDLM